MTYDDTIVIYGTVLLIAVVAVIFFKDSLTIVDQIAVITGVWFVMVIGEHLFLLCQ